MNETSEVQVCESKRYEADTPHFPFILLFFPPNTQSPLGIPSCLLSLSHTRRRAGLSVFLQCE